MPTEKSWLNPLAASILPYAGQSRLPLHNAVQVQSDIHFLRSFEMVGIASTMSTWLSRSVH